MRKLRLFLIIAVLAFVSGQNLFAQGLEDITSKLKNPALDSKDGWTFIKEGTKDWSNIAGAAPFNVVETYAGWGELGEITTFTMKQDVTLDAGTYRFVSQSFHRGDVGGAKVFAKVGETVKEVDVAKINQFQRWPDNVGQASKAFATNAYLNVVEFTVESNSTVVTLGIDGEHKAKQEWFIAGPCKLYAVKNEVSSTYPLDVTHMVNRANTAIEGVSGTYESNVWVHEKYSETPFPVGDIMSTAITGLENGTYQVEIYAAASSAWGKSTVPAEKPYLYANDVKVDVTATETNGVDPVPVFTLDNVVVSDGTLNLGFSNRAEGSNWNLFYIKSIKMVAPAAPAVPTVENIAALKALENGSEFKLTLTDAKITLYAMGMRGSTVILEDATGAIDASEFAAVEGFIEQNVLNGTLYGVYRNEWGAITIGLTENTEKSELTAVAGTVVPTKFTFAEVKDNANLYRFVELNDCKAVQDTVNYTWWAISGTDSIAITDRFQKTINWETYEQEIPANIQSITGIVMFDGEKWVICPYAYGENKAIVAAVVAAVENITLTPQGTIIWGNGDDSKGETPNTNGDNNYYNASATTWNVSQSAVSNGSFKNNNSPYGGSYILISKFDGSSTLNGKMVQKAILNFTSVCTVSGKNSDVQVAAIGTNWDPATATWNTVNTAEIMNAVQIHDGTNVKTSPKDFVIDVTDLLAADEDKVFGIAIYTKTAREQKISNLSLDVQAIDASASADYLVKYATAEGTVVRTDTITGTIGGQIAISDEAKQPFYNADKSEKYIYVADDAAGKTIAGDGSTVVTVTVRLAEQFRYSVVAVDESGELLQTLNTDFNFEGESFKVPYNKYVLNYSDSTLYASDATSKEYNKSVTLSEDGAQFKVTFKKTDIKNVIYLQEAEDIWGLTKATNGNTGIRSSNSASAYAAEEDVEITGLSTGKYKLTAVICDATKNAGSTFKFAVAEDTVASITATAVNWFEGTSNEFTVIGNYVPVKLLKGGSNNQAVDFVYIQKTGGVPSVVVENIADVKKVKSGTPVNLKLNNAKVTVQAYAMMGSFTVIEDATGAIPLSGNMALEGIYEKQALNGNLYVTYVNEWGSEQLDLADSTMYSNFTSEAAEVAPVEMTYAAVKDSANMYRFVKLGACKTVFDEEMWMYYAVSGTDTLAIVDRFNKTLNWETYEQEIPAEVEYMTGLIMFDGEQWVIYPYAYGEDKAIVGVAQPEDIVVNVTEGEISAAVEAEKAKVAKVGNITVNLTAGAAYTIANTIEIPAGFILNGNGATIDASALGANFIQSAVTEEAKTVDSIAVLNVTVKGLGKALYYSAGKNIGISNFVVDNSVIEMAKDVVVFDFTKGSAALNFAVKNSTIYAQTATTKSIYSSQGGEKGDAYGATVDTPQTFSFENTTLYNIAYNKNFFTHRSNGQKWMKFVVKNNVIVNSGKANFMTSLNGGQDSPNPIYDADAANSVGTLVDGAYTDLSASQTVQSNAMGTSVVTNPGFKDVAAGDFTVYAGSEQAKQKIGDPRWLVEFDETLTGIDGINAADTLNGAVYTINGIKVREAGETLKGLSKGMYIINGKKYVVK